MLSALWETSVPSSTGNVSRMRPVRRESTIARAGSPRRAGRVADISTPTIVAEATSRRRRGRRGSAARAIEYQEPARRNIEAIISAVATRTQVASERTMLVTTRSTPTRWAAMKVSPTPIARGDTEADRGARCGGGRRRARGRGVERGQAASRNPPVAVGGQRGRACARAARRAVRGLGDRARALVDALDPRGDRAARRSARADSRAASPIAARRSGARLSAWSSSARRCGIGRRDQDPVVAAR